MKSTQKTKQGQEFLAFNEANIAKVEGLEKRGPGKSSWCLSSFTKRISLSYSTDSTVKTYRRSVRDLSLFHGCLPIVLETDETLDYLHFLKDKGFSWAKIKLDAGHPIMASSAPG